MATKPGYTVKKIYVIICDRCNEDITRPLMGGDVETRAEADEEIREHQKDWHADDMPAEPDRASRPRKWAIWSWDGRNGYWMAVSEGSEKAMTAELASRRSAAARVMPSARFTMTPKSQPPQEPPE